MSGFSLEQIITAYKGIGYVLGGFATAGGVAWGGYEFVDSTRNDLEEQVRANTERIEVVAGALERLRNTQDLDRWQYLNKKRQTIGLTLSEYQEWCALGAKLFANYICPEFNNGQPVGAGQ